MQLLTGARHQLVEDALRHKVHCDGNMMVSQASNLA